MMIDRNAEAALGLVIDEDGIVEPPDSGILTIAQLRYILGSPYVLPNDGIYQLSVGAALLDVATSGAPPSRAIALGFLYLSRFLTNEEGDGLTQTLLDGFENIELAFGEMLNK